MQGYGEIVVGMSGGVDSSVTAKLLSATHPGKVSGVFMKNWEESNGVGTCTATQDMLDAKMVCDLIEIKFCQVNFSEDYRRDVFAHFLTEYEAGRTPNPDVYCNQEIKFKAFLRYAIEAGANQIATGHYARKDEQAGMFRLLKGVDPNKDQSYFLYRLNQEQLEHTLFPIGGMHKTEIRRIAAESRFLNKDKKDSTGICFIGERNFKVFLSQFITPKQGEVRTLDGATLGEHDGIFFYTLGQRKGLSIGGIKDRPDRAWYVVRKDKDNNILYVSQDTELLSSKELWASHCHWIVEVPKTGVQIRAKTRYRQADQACQVIHADSETCYLRFEKLQRAVTPGQSVVLYDGDVCLGGGIIDKTDQFEDVSRRTNY